MNKYFKSRYLIRLDDANHYCNVDKWRRIEFILDKYNITPIVAVVPFNKDENLIKSKYNELFWEKVKSWENKKWTIALHGYKHLYHEVDKKNLMFPFYNRSEFGGLTLKKQKEILNKSLKIFTNNGICPKVFVAPSHTFDFNTLKALKSETSIRIISDGIAFNQFYLNNFHFIPQQLWSLKKRLKGLWTVCLHPDTMTEVDFENLEKSINNIGARNIISINEINFSKRRKSILDNLFSKYFWFKYLVLDALNNLRHK